MLETNPFGDFNQILKYLKHNYPLINSPRKDVYPSNTLFN